jgi:hypothetical protein
MAQVIFQGRNGLSNSIKNDDNKYSVGDNVDPFRDWGFLKPSFEGTTIVAEWDSYIRDMAYSNALLALTETKIFSVNTVNNTATSVHNLPFGTAGSKIIRYSTKVGGTVKPYSIFYFYGITGGLYDGTDYTDNWIAATPAGGGSFSGNGVAACMVWQNFLMLGHGQYIAKFDGNTGDNGTITLQWFDLGSDWTVRSFFSYYNYLGAVIYNQVSGETQIILLDGSSTSLPVKRISISDSVLNSININNDLIFLAGNEIKQLGDNGLEMFRDLSFESKTTVGSTTNYTINYSDKLSNKIYIGSGSYIFGFSKKDANNPYTISKLYDTTGANITMIKGVNSRVFASSSTGTTYYLQYFSTGGSTATLKFTFKDFGQRVRINYVKYYFKPLSSGDTMTAGIDIDYGTSITLKDSNNASTIAYATDGRISSKKFKVGRDCFSFRPTVSSWNLAELSYVVVDFDYILDN